MRQDSAEARDITFESREEQTAAAERVCARILVVEDDPKIAAALCASLKGDGHLADWESGVREARIATGRRRYDLVVLDLSLPGGDGVDLLRHWRSTSRSIPVIAVTARAGLEDRISTLDAGADDYLAKPFEMGELLARVRAILRRPGGALGKILHLANLEFDTVRRELKIANRRLKIPRRELAILELLMRNAETVVDRDAVMRGAYASDEHVSSNVLEANVSRLRQRLREAGATLEIRTVRGVGYVLRSIS